MHGTFINSFWLKGRGLLFVIKRDHYQSQIKLYPRDTCAWFLKKHCDGHIAGVPGVFNHTWPYIYIYCKGRLHPISTLFILSSKDQTCKSLALLQLDTWLESLTRSGKRILFPPRSPLAPLTTWTSPLLLSILRRTQTLLFIMILSKPVIGPSLTKTNIPWKKLLSISSSKSPIRNTLGRW